MRCVSHRQAFIVRVEPDGTYITIEDVRAARAAQVEKLACVGIQIERWLALAEPEQEASPEEPQRSR